VKQISKDEFKKMYESGMLVKDMARDLGVSNVTINNWVNKLGLKGRRSIRPLIKDAG